MNLAIGIPTINRMDLLLPSLMLLKHDCSQFVVYVLDNGNQGIGNHINDPNIRILHNRDNVGVAASWNQLCYLIFQKHTHALILNDDIVLGRKDYEIMMFLNQYPNKDFYLGMLDWSAFIIPQNTFKKVGDFDEEFFPAYYEDNDYEYRMRMMGMNIYRVPFLNPVIYRNSMSGNADPKLLKYAESNKKRYIEKWGGLPEKEKYRTPFNYTKTKK